MESLLLSERICRILFARFHLERAEFTLRAAGNVRRMQFQAPQMTNQEVQASEKVRQTVAQAIISGVETLLEDAQAATKPLEIDPYRSRLFELFVTADGAKLIGDERTSQLTTAVVSDEDETDLSADGLCRSLARRWGLDMAARDSAASQTKLPPEQLERMRLLWSIMRMWMEWNYSWCRWEEFHKSADESEQAEDD